MKRMDHQRLPRRIDIALHTYSFHSHLCYKQDYDIYAFLDDAERLGVTGVHISMNGPNYRWVDGTSAEHLTKLGQEIRDRGFFLEVDTSGTGAGHLKELVEACRLIGADKLRTYASPVGEHEDKITSTIAGLREVAPMAADNNITILLENHEEFTGKEIRHILETVDHPTIAAIFDFGNSMMVLEDPMEAAREMAPFIRSVHLKDHVLCEQKEPAIRGVPIGRGRVHIKEILDFLLKNTTLERICVESVYGFHAPIRRNHHIYEDVRYRFCTFKPYDTNVGDMAVCPPLIDTMVSTDLPRLLNYEVSAASLGVGKVREYLSDLGWCLAEGGKPGQYIN